MLARAQPGVEGGHDVGMIQAGDGAHLTQKARDQLGRLVGVDREHFERDLTAHEDVFRLENYAAAAGPHASQDAVIAQDQRVDAAPLDAVGLIVVQQLEVDEPDQ